MSLKEKMDQHGNEQKLQKLYSALPNSQVPEDKETELIGRTSPLNKTEIHKDEEGLYWIRDADEGISVAVFAPKFAKELAETLIEDLEQRDDIE